ncbi:hypothetical protein COLO4_04333 [Corchorus olitorius]|uniref:Uncharacterized protein n=1 Tax=Corchorus olitorius TaxID=93759 RepID=A0A1R3KUH4_9ROSI|nr:hypothetical protein COLO4_04333 [Corchorus olitorius]
MDESVKEKGQLSGEQSVKEAVAKPMPSREAEEFLKFIKYSEYSMVDALSRLPAKISMYLKVFLSLIWMG